MEQLTARNIVAFATALAILVVVGFGVVIRGGANSATQAQDLVSIAQGFQKAFSNQSYQYGTATLAHAILVNSGKVDPNIVSAGTINSRWQTAMVFTGATNSFTAALTGIPYNNCTDLLLDQSLAEYVSQINVTTSGTGGTPATLTPPATPADAAGACGSGGVTAFTITFLGHP